MARKKDVNIVVITGEVISEPYIMELKSGQNLLKFEIKCVETYKTRDQIDASHQNTFPVEVIGRNALTYKNLLRSGSTCQITGYLRQDVIGQENKIRIRCLHMETE